MSQSAVTAPLFARRRMALSASYITPKTSPPEKEQKAVINWKITGSFKAYLKRRDQRLPPGADSS